MSDWGWKNMSKTVYGTKVNLGQLWHIARHHDADGSNSEYVRSAHSQGGPIAFRRCVADKMRGNGGDWRSHRAAFASAAHACKGTRGR